MAAIFPDYILKWNFLNENVQIWIKISLMFVSMSLIDNILALVRRTGDKP